MAAFMILQIAISDRERMRKYSQAVLPLMANFGGKQVVRGAKVELLEGAHGGRALSMFEFPSLEAIHAFWASPEYVPVREIRRDAAVMDIWAVEGI